jgi:hypothetical protein
VKKIILAVLLGLLAVGTVTSSIGCDSSSGTKSSAKK